MDEAWGWREGSKALVSERSGRQKVLGMEVDRLEEEGRYGAGGQYRKQV